MRKLYKHSAIMWFLFITSLFACCSTKESERLSRGNAVFAFEVTADMRQFAGPEYQTSQYFMGACEAIRDLGKGAFMVSPGDIDPPEYVYNTVHKVLGNKYTWYPVVGNHEAETPEDMEWLRDWKNKELLPTLINRGPKNCEETTYSFDFKNAHLVVINEYYNGISDTGADGIICDSLYKWLKNDLKRTSKPFIFVFGHEPIISIPDADNGRYRHKGDNLDAYPKHNHSFMKLIKKHKVTAFFNGHTHNFSFTKINGLWQIDAGHCRGIGDKWARSTFLKIWVGKKNCWVDVYRDNGNGGHYSLTRTIILK